MWALKKLWYRIFQFVLTSALYIMPWRQPELLSGPGSIKKLPAFVRSKGINKVLIVTDAVLHRIGLLDSLFAACKEANLEYVLFDGAEPNPSIENIEDARKLYVENKCQGIIAFGGGSSMDCAKAAARALSSPVRASRRWAAR